MISSFSYLGFKKIIFFTVYAFFFNYYYAPLLYWVFIHNQFTTYRACRERHNQSTSDLLYCDRRVLKINTFTRVNTRSFTSEGCVQLADLENTEWTSCFSRESLKYMFFSKANFGESDLCKTVKRAKKINVLDSVECHFLSILLACLQQLNSEWSFLSLLFTELQLATNRMS